MVKYFIAMILSFFFVLEAMAKYEPRLVDYRNLIEFQKNGQKIQYSQSVYDSKNKLSKVSDVGARLFNSMNLELNNELGNELKNLSYYDSHKAQLSGPLVIDINQGYARLSGLKFSTAAKFIKRASLLGFIKVSAQCSFHFYTPSSFSFDGQLNVASGDLNNLQLKDFNLSFNQDCSSSFDWIPFIGSRINSLLNGKVKSLVQNKITSINSRFPIKFSSINFIGLNDVLSDGAYIISGYDAGKELRMSLISKLNQLKLRLVLNNLNSQAASSYYDRSSVSLSDLNFEAYFYNFDISIKIIDVKTYTYVWNNLCGVNGAYRCYEP